VRDLRGEVLERAHVAALGHAPLARHAGRDLALDLVLHDPAAQIGHDDRAEVVEREADAPADRHHGGGPWALEEDQHAHAGVGDQVRVEADPAPRGALRLLIGALLVREHSAALAPPAPPSPGLAPFLAIVPVVVPDVAAHGASASSMGGSHPESHARARSKSRARRRAVGKSMGCARGAARSAARELHREAAECSRIAAPRDAGGAIVRALPWRPGDLPCPSTPSP
jgi:hypothetical protein